MGIILVYIYILWHLTSEGMMHGKRLWQHLTFYEFHNLIKIKIKLEYNIFIIILQ